MGTQIGRNVTSLIEDLVRNGPSYNVWQAVWLAENITRKYFPSRHDEIFDQTGLRFRPYEKYVYPPKDINSVSFEDGVMTFILTFMGLYGINSPLPRCYHDQVALQQRLLGKGEVPLQNFYDIFNNRFYWLYYQSWKKYRYHLFFNNGSENRITARINSFIGKNLFNSKNKSSLPDLVLIKFSGIFGRRIRNKAGLKILLTYLFPGFKSRIHEFIPHNIELTDIPALGSPENRLGLNSFIGKYTVSCSSRIRIEFSEISFEEYLSFLPGGINLQRITELLRMYLNDGLEYDLSFTIRSESITMISWDDNRLKLGSTLWLGRPKEQYVVVNLPYEELYGSKYEYN